MRFFVLLGAVAESPAEKILHDIHEVVGWVVLTLAWTIFVIGGAQTCLMCRKTKIGLAIDRSSVLRAVRDLCRSYLEPAYRKLFLTGVLTLCGMLYRRLEIGMLDRFNYAIANSVRKLSNLFFIHVEVSGIDRFNYVLAGALTDICVWLRLKLDVVGSYYVAIIWFVGGVLVSLILLFMV